MFSKSNTMFLMFLAFTLSVQSMNDVFKKENLE